MAVALLEAPEKRASEARISILPRGPFRTEVRRLTVDEYERMIRLRVLGEDERLELIEGFLVTIMPPNPPHSTSVYLVNRRLDRALPEGWILRAENPIRLDFSAPLPDGVVVRGSAVQFARKHPTPGEIALIVEVADSSLEGDRTDKARIYARNGLPEYWIVNLEELQIEVYTQPQAEVPHYLKRVDYKFGDKVPFSLNGQVLTEFAVEEVFPSANASDEGE